MPQDIAMATIKVIATHLDMDPADLTPETSLDELGANSLQLTEIIMDVEDMFDIQIEQNTAEAWASLKTVGNIIQAVEALAGAKC